MFFIISPGKKYYCPYCDKVAAKLHLQVEIIYKNQREVKHLVTLRHKTPHATAKHNSPITTICQHLGGFRRNIDQNQVEIPHWTMPNAMDVWEHIINVHSGNIKRAVQCAPLKKRYSQK